MSIIHLTEASGGAPRLSGTNGDLCAVLDWALVQNSWTIDFTASNARVYRPPSGNRFSMFVQHDSAVSGNAGLAVVRGCESASAAAIASLTNPFPTVAQVAAASANWPVSNAANTTSRNFDIYVAPTWVIYIVNYGGATNVWDFSFFGDCSPMIAADTWATVCSTRAATGAPAAMVGVGAPSNEGSTFGSAAGIYFCRSIDGTVNSTHGAINTNGSTGLGALTNGDVMFSSPTALIDRRKVPVMCNGSASTGAFTTGKGHYMRAYLPNIWHAIHSGRGTANSRDTFTDTAYSGSATFRVWTASNSAASTGGILIAEETTTWSAPLG